MSSFNASSTTEKNYPIEKCVIFVDKLDDLYDSKALGAQQRFPEVDEYVGSLITYAKGTGHKARTAQACLFKAAMLGYPSAQLEYVNLFQETKSNFNKQLARVFYTLLKKNPAAPESLKNKAPHETEVDSRPMNGPEQQPETALAYSWFNSSRGKKWAKFFAPFIGIADPDHFIKGAGSEVLDCVPTLMLGMYNLPVADCVNAEYINDIYTSTENKEKFYNTVANYRLPRFSWIDRVKVPVMGLLSKLHLSSDFKSEGHKMCAAADIIVMLLCKDLYHETAEGLDARKPLALQTLTKMAKNGFPAAQLALSVYLRQCGVKEHNAAKITKACFWANKAKENDYTTNNEKLYINDNQLLETSLTDKEQAIRDAAKESRAQTSRHEDPASTRSTRIQRIKPNPRSAKVTRINPRQGKGQGE